MIDLRSDTVTRPTQAMREAMLAAPVGDDVYDDDPSVHELEGRVAEAFGHQAALFCASGSLANLIGVRLLAEPGQEVVCDVGAHVARAEMGAHAAVHGLTMRTFPSDHGRATPRAVAELLSPNAGPYLVSTAAVAVENTHNFGGGTVQSLPDLEQISELCLGAGVGRHLDGARLWNAHVATGTSLGAFGALYDTISVCFSKGLGAPVGSVLISSREHIARARVLRKRLGGGWRQAGLLAAGALYAFEHHIERLADDHAAARAFADEVAGLAPSAVAPEAVETNIVVIDTGALSAADVSARMLETGVAISALGPHLIRAVTHLDVDLGQCRTAGRQLGELLRG